MAIVATYRIAPAGQDDHDRLQDEVEARIASAGGPPDGLMVHVACPEGDGVVIVEAWRSEDAFHSYFDELLLPAAREVGVQPSDPAIAPAWSIARP